MSEAGIDFRLLGPFEVLVDGRDLTPSRPKRRALLALLLLRGNEIVASDELIEALWDERPPETAQSALQGHISALRKLLGKGTIETRPPGYVLHVTPSETDLGRLQVLLERAREAPEASDRARLLREALSLFRGEALADFRYEEFARAEAERLEDLRLSALEERIDAELELGLHADLAGELRRLVAANPLRERLRGELMLALYRSGRQADALNAYQDARRVLSEQLGLDPGPALRELEQKMLAQDPSLVSAAVSAAVEPTEWPEPPSDQTLSGGAGPEEPRRERKVVTVLFCDLVGFTAQAETRDPEDVQALLEPYFAKVRRRIEEFSGIVEKFIGDAVLGVFGAPAAHEDDPERAVMAALAIRDDLADELQHRIAVNTGPALVTLDADPHSGTGIVIGDVVNTASRLQALAPIDGVVVGEETRRATESTIEYRELQPIVAPGKREPIAAWEALGKRARGSSRGFEGVFVGRDRELDQLVDALARARAEGSVQLATILGVPGIGKTRLVRELRRQIESDGVDVNWLQGRCLPYGEGVAFWALGEIVKSQAGILETDAAPQIEAKLHRCVAGVVTEESEALWLERELRPLAGLPSEPGAAGEGGQGEAFAAWRRFLEGLAERGPVVLAFEDLHWADEGLLDFIDELADWIRGVPLLVVGTARPEFLERREKWGGGKPNATTISLQPLGDEDAARLMSNLLGEPAPAEGERHGLLDRIGGNPLFAEQYVRMLVERGMPDELPTSVQAMIAARLDALPRGEKDLVQEAAVQGRVFWLGGVAATRGHAESDVAALLHGLERKEFIRRERRSAVAGDTQYAFTHVLLRDVAYGQIPRRSREDRHLRAAEWIERLGRRDDHAEMLAHHYGQALELARAAGAEDDPSLVERARDSLRRAGERAMALSAYTSAAEFFARALELCADDAPDRPRLLLGRARGEFGSGAAGLDTAIQALEGFRAAGDSEGAAQAATLAARFSWFAGDRAATDRYIGLALEIVGDRAGSRAKAEALTNQSGFHMLGGEFEASIEVGAQALPLVEELDMGAQRARVHIVVGCARACLGDEDGLREVETGIAVARDSGSPEMLVIGHGNLGSELFFFGRLDESRRAMEESLELSERYQLTRMQRSGRTEVAGWKFAAGEWDDALRTADELIAAADAGDADYSDPQVLSMRAWMRLARGDGAGADADSGRAAELASASDAQARSAAFCVRARWALDTGRRDEAEKRAADLAEIGRVLLPALCAPTTTFADVAWVFRDLGREEEFVRVLDATPIEGPWMDAAGAIVAGRPANAAEIIDAMGHRACTAYARLRAAEALSAESRQSEALEQVGPAKAFYRAVGAAGYLRRCEALVEAVDTADAGLKSTPSRR